jgi:hypothetical protein
VYFGAAAATMLDRYLAEQIRGQKPGFIGSDDGECPCLGVCKSGGTIPLPAARRRNLSPSKRIQFARLRTVAACNRHFGRLDHLLRGSGRLFAELGVPAMSANDPSEPPPGGAASEYAELDVDLFLQALSTVLNVMAGKLPCAEGFTLAPGPPIVLADTPFNRGMYTATLLFPDPAQRLSFVWRAVVVMGVAMDNKYRDYRNDAAGLMHIALATTVAKVRGGERTTKDELRESFDRMFRSLLETTRSDGKFPTA